MNEHKTMRQGAAQLVINETGKEILDKYLQLRYMKSGEKCECLL